MRWWPWPSHQDLHLPVRVAATYRDVPVQFRLHAPEELCTHPTHRLALSTPEPWYLHSHWIPRVKQSGNDPSLFAARPPIGDVSLSHRMHLTANQRVYSWADNP
jgi:hypothetical protein